ncbi:hypothetical protein T484DRAFT_1827192, partial [Baffinella frigidus]
VLGGNAKARAVLLRNADRFGVAFQQLLAITKANVPIAMHAQCVRLLSVLYIDVQASNQRSYAVFQDSPESRSSVSLTPNLAGISPLIAPIPMMALLPLFPTEVLPSFARKEDGGAEGGGGGGGASPQLTSVTLTGAQRDTLREVLVKEMKSLGAVSRMTSGHNRFAIALVDAMEAMLDRGFLHTSPQDRSAPDLALMGTIAEALVHMLDMRSRGASRAGPSDKKPALFKSAGKDRWFVKKVLSALNLLQKLLEHSTEHVLTGVVDAWERMMESRFACADFDVAAALLQQPPGGPGGEDSATRTLRDYAQRPDMWLSPAAQPWRDEDVGGAALAMHACTMLPELRDGVLDPACTTSAISDGIEHLPRTLCVVFTLLQLKSGPIKERALAFLVGSFSYRRMLMQRLRTLHLITDPEQSQLCSRIQWQLCSRIQTDSKT